MGPLNRESYKIDYNMLTKYYRVIQPRRVFEKLVEDEHGRGELATFINEAKVVGASVSPFEALKLMVKDSEMWEIPLGKPRSGVSLKGAKT